MKRIENVMNHLLFELLENAGFLKGSTINIDRIARAKRSELVSVAEQSAELTPTSSVTNCDPVFSHTASLTLGGGPTPCVWGECRIKRARELVQFASFYSDRIFVNNNLFSSSGRLAQTPIDEARFAFEDELKIILVFKPLIESGLIVPVTPTTTLCYHCLGKSVLPSEDRKRFDRTFREYAQRFERETKTTLEYLEDGQVGLNITGNEKLIEHGAHFQDWGEIKQFAAEHPQLAQRLHKQKNFSLSKAQRKKFEVDADMAHSLFNDIGFEMAVSQCLKSSIVTSREVHVEILHDFVRSAELNRRNALIQKHLTCIVPFLNDVPTHDLLALRKGEEDAFIAFRQAFGKAVDEYLKSKRIKLTELDAVAIYRDLIEPELARLNQKVNSASKTLFKKARAGVFGWVAAISAGHYLGFLDSGLIAIAKALGLTKVAADLASGFMASSGEDAIRNENMYFLWKVRHRAERA